MKGTQWSSGYTFYSFTVFYSSHIQTREDKSWYLPTTDRSSCRYQTRNLARCFGGRAGLIPAVISAKFILILQRGLIFQWCLCFPLTVQGVYISGSQSHWRQLSKPNSWHTKERTKSHPAWELDQQRAVWFEKTLHYTIVYWLQRSIGASVFSIFLSEGGMGPGSAARGCPPGRAVLQSPPSAS